MIKTKILKDKKLLVLTQWFPSPDFSYSSPFVYDYVFNISNFFAEVYVFSLIPNIPYKLLNRFPLNIKNYLGINKRWHKQTESPTFGKNYTKENVNVFYIKHFPLIFKFRSFRSLYATYSKMIKIIKEKNISIDLIHAHFLYPSGCLGMLTKSKLNIPLVITGHGSDIHTLPFKGKKIKGILKKTIKASDIVFSVGKGNKKILIDYLGADEKRTFIMPNSVDPKKFHKMELDKVKELLRIPADKKIILTIGNLLEEKGLDYLIKAAEKLYKKIKNIKFIIIGNGPQYKYLTSMIKKLNLKKVVNILDPMPQDELRLWLNASHVFVLPSLKEGLGMVQIEAMACGKPVVATRNGGSETIITNENLGILVESKNSDELAKGIYQALNKSWNSKYIISHAMKFTPSKISKEIAYIFSNLLRNTE